MNELERTEQSLRRLMPRKTPPHLRTCVLDAIEAQRIVEAQEEGPHAKPSVPWLTRMDQTASFAAPCLLAFSLLVFSLVNRSVDNLYRGHSDSASPVRPTNSDPSFAKKERPSSPQAFFHQHFTILKNLNEELFRDSHQESNRIDHDQTPLGFLRRVPARHFGALARNTRNAPADDLAM